MLSGSFSSIACSCGLLGAHRVSRTHTRFIDFTPYDVLAPYELCLDRAEDFVASGRGYGAGRALAFYRELFRIERRIKDLSDEERLRERQEKTVPLLAQFKAWLDYAVHTVAVGRKAFPFVGSERAGHAAAIGKKR
jgi:hypothetical protein